MNPTKYYVEENGKMVEKPLEEIQRLSEAAGFDENGAPVYFDYMIDDGKKGAEWEEKWGEDWRWEE